MAGGNIVLFMAPANDTNCTSTTSSFAPYFDTVYTIQIILTSIVMLASKLHNDAISAPDTV